jgi:lipopolysaccharide export system ATP-binding protein
MATLEATDLVKRYGSRTVVRGISISVERGEVVGLLGRNGAGKSTTFKMIMGLVKPDHGQIMLNGHDVTRLALYKRARRGLGYLAQEPTVFQKLSVQDNLRAVLETTSLSRAEQSAKLEQLLGEFGLAKIRKNMAASCSGGERRRLEIARTLVTDPKVVLLDEPFAGVDPIAREEIKALVVGLAQRNIGVLLTDHNVDTVLPMTTRSYIVIEGQVLKEGSPREVAEDPVVRKEYLGEKFELRPDSGRIARMDSVRRDLGEGKR